MADIPLFLLNIIQTFKNPACIWRKEYTTGELNDFRKARRRAAPRTAGPEKPSARVASDSHKTHRRILPRRRAILWLKIQRNRAGKPATQRQIPIAEIKDGVVIPRDGTLRSVLLVSSINFFLKSEDEQNAIIAAYVGFLNSIDFPPRS